MNIIYFLIQSILFACGPLVQRLFTTYHTFVPEIWSFYSNSESANVALPDSYATYFSSYVYLNDDEFLTVKGSVENYDYYSLQVYDSRAITLGNVNYLQSVNGSINLIITKDIRNLQNTTNTNIINIDSNNTIFLVVFRVYDLFETPLDTHLLVPNVSIMNSKIGNLPKANNFVKLDYNWLWTDKAPVRFPKFSTTDNNFLKPALTSFFYNGDASYLISNIQNPSESLGIIIKGVLPDSTQVMYSSFNIGVSSSPMPTIAGKHYQNDPRLISSTGRAGIRHIEIEKRYNIFSSQNDEKILSQVDKTLWNRHYTIYVGLDLDHIRRLGGDPDVDLYLLYPIQYFTGKPYTNVIILHRHLMHHPSFSYAIANVAESHADPQVCNASMDKYYPSLQLIK